LAVTVRGLDVLSSIRKPRVAVVGAGLAGAACASQLKASGFDVVVFEKSRGVGGRMATRRARWISLLGKEETAEFDHGAPYFAARHRQFRELMAAAADKVCTWSPRLLATDLQVRTSRVFVATPTMNAMCRFLLDDVDVHLDHEVLKLMPTTVNLVDSPPGTGREKWLIATADGRASGPFDSVVIAIPPAQATKLLVGLGNETDEWARALLKIQMTPCWTLMAVSSKVNLEWDIAETDGDVIARIIRNDRKPGRTNTPAATTWVAHASPAWTAAHLEIAKEEAADLLGAALHAFVSKHTALKSVGQSLQWHYRAAHRWRYATPPPSSLHPADSCWWNQSLGLGICGDYFGNEGVEDAWVSGNALATRLANLLLA
jgi:renalase